MYTQLFPHFDGKGMNTTLQSWTIISGRTSPMYSAGGIYTTYPNRWWAYSGLVPKHRELPMSRASWSLPPPPFTDMLHYNSAPQPRPLQEFGSNFEECCKSGKKCWSDTKSRDISFQKEIWSYSTSYQEEGGKNSFLIQDLIWQTRVLWFGK